MANGIIVLTASGKLPGYLNGRIAWSSTSNGTAANTSSVTAQLQISRNSSVATSGTWYGSLNVGGTTNKISYYASIGSDWVTIDTLTATVSHNADGSGSCYIYGLLNGPTETSMEGTSVSGGQTVTLDTIPRFAAIASAPDFHDEENPTITYTNPAGSSVTTLEACISLDGSKADIAYRSISKTGQSYTFSLTEAERGVLRAATTDANSRKVYFCIRTSIGSSTGTSSLAKTFTIKDPAPTIAPTIVDSNSATIALTGNSSKLIRYYSNAAITMGAAAVKGASLTSKKVTCGNKRLTSDGTIQGVESGSFVFSATDNRGNTTTKTVTVSFVDYVKLTCSPGNEIPDADGNMTVTATGNFFNGSFGAKSNTLQVFYRYKPYGGSYGNWTAMTVTISGHTYSATADVTGLDYQTAYVFQIYAADALATVYSGERVVKATPVFDWSEKDFSFHVPVAMPGNGLGVIGYQAPSLSDANDGINTGWYRITADTENGVGVSAVMRVESYSQTTVIQRVFSGNYSQSYHLLQQRISHPNLGWGQWEWVDPPMVLGAEYRTTERFTGAAVYKKALFLGGVSAGGTLNVTHNIAGINYAISCILFDSDGTISQAAEYVRFTPTEITVVLPGNVGGKAMYALLSYTVNR